MAEKKTLTSAKTKKDNISKASADSSQNFAALLKNDAAKVPQVGDTVAGLKVSEIKESEVVLKKGDRTFTVTLETEVKVKASEAR